MEMQGEGGGGGWLAGTRDGGGHLLNYRWHELNISARPLEINLLLIERHPGDYASP